METVFDIQIPIIKPDDVNQFIEDFNQKIAHIDTEFTHTFRGSQTIDHGPNWYRCEFRLSREGGLLFGPRDLGLCGRCKIWSEKNRIGSHVWIDLEILNYRESFCPKKVNEIIDLYIQGLKKLKNFILANSNIVEYQEIRIVYQEFFYKVYNVA